MYVTGFIYRERPIRLDYKVSIHMVVLVREMSCAVGMCTVPYTDGLYGTVWWSWHPCHQGLQPKLDGTVYSMAECHLNCVVMAIRQQYGFVQHNEPSTHRAECKPWLSHLLSSFVHTLICLQFVICALLPTSPSHCLDLTPPKPARHWRHSYYLKPHQTPYLANDKMLPCSTSLHPFLNWSCLRLDSPSHCKIS